MTTSSYPGGFAGGVTIRNMPVLNIYSRKAFWVDSNGSGGRDGTFDRPFATLSDALAACVASRGDVILVKAGHAETLNALAMDKAGVAIIGLGTGDNRPAISSTAAAAAMVVSADDCAVCNLRWVGLSSGTQTGTIKVSVTGADFTFWYNKVEADASDDDNIYLDTGSARADIRYNEFVVLANGPDTAINIAAVIDGIRVEENLFNGGSVTNAWDLSTILSASAHTNCLIKDNVITNIASGLGGIQFTAAATGIISGNVLGNGTLGQMLDPGSCMCFNNLEADAVDETARVFPTTPAS